MILRRFNDAGMLAFKQFLEAARQNPSAVVPLHLLEDKSFTTVVAPEIHVEPQHFQSRSDAATFLRALLEPLSDHRVANDAELWTWLTLFFFDEVCPSQNGRRAVKNDYCYIFQPKNSRHFYRHRLYIAWRALELAPSHNRLFLSGTVPSLDQVTAEVFKRLYLTRVPCIFEVLDRLYWDEKRGRVRPGIVTREKVKPGDLIHRFPIRIRQLEKTYDLISLNADQLIELLGAEFQQGGEVAAA